MVLKKLFIAALVVGAAAISTAKNTIRLSHPPGSAYRIELRNSGTVLSKDQPVRRGSVVLFHRFTDGSLTSIPWEDVAVVVADRPHAAASTAPAGAVALQPGDAVLLGPTGEGPVAETPRATSYPAPNASSDIARSLAMEAQVFPGDIPVPTGPGTGTGAMYNGVPLYGGSYAPASGRPSGSPGVGLPRPGIPITYGSNGFPASSVQPVDANGFPSMNVGAASGAQTTASATAGKRATTAAAAGSNSSPSVATAPARAASTPR